MLVCILIMCIIGLLGIMLKVVHYTGNWPTRIGRLAKSEDLVSVRWGLVQQPSICLTKPQENFCFGDIFFLSVLALTGNLK